MIHYPTCLCTEEDLYYIFVTGTVDRKEKI